MMADGKTPEVTFGSALTKTIYIARRLRRRVGDQEMVGMLLPPSVGGALANYALVLLGPRSSESELHFFERSHRFLR